MRTHLLLFALCLGLGTSVLAQNAVISGTVTDPGGCVMGATVKILQDDHFIKGAVTNNDGFYSIGGITSGTYRVEISLVGYNPFTDTITLAPGQAVILDRAFSSMQVPMDLIIEVKKPTVGLVIDAVPITRGNKRTRRLLHRIKPNVNAPIIAETKEHPVYKQGNSIDGIILKSDFISKHPTRMW